MTYDTLSKLRNFFCAALFSAAAMASAQEHSGISRSTFERPRSAEAYKPTIGLRFGVADTEGNYNGSMDYGIEAGFQPYIPFGLAMELSSYVSSAEGTLPSLTRTKLIAKGTYNFGGDIPLIRHSYVGAGLGPVWDNVANSTYINFGFAPLVGFDIPLVDLASRYSLGANASYLFVSGARADVFALNAMAKYWF